MSFTLIPDEDESPARPTLELAGRELVLGRTKECQIQDIMCSRQHLKITPSGNKSVECLNTSKQSAMVQKVAGGAWEVLQPGTSASIRPGGKLALLGTSGANCRLKYRVSETASVVRSNAASNATGGSGSSPAVKRAKKSSGGGGGWAAGLGVYLDNPRLVGRWCQSSSVLPPPHYHGTT